MFGKEKSLLEQENEDFANSPAQEMYEEDYRADERPLEKPQQYNSQPDFMPQGRNKSQLGFDIMNGETILWESRIKTQDKGINAESAAIKVQKIGNIVTTIYTKVFAVIWLGFAIVWTLIAFQGNMVMALFGLPFIIIGIILLFKKPQGNKSIGLGASSYPDDAYAITNFRVIKRNGGLIQNDNLREIYDITYTSEDGVTGSVVYSKGARSDNSNTNFTSDNTGIISNIQNPQMVCSMLSNAVNSANQ